MNLGFKSRIYSSVALLVALSLGILGTLNIISLKEKMVSSLISETQNKLNYHVDELQHAVTTQLKAVELGARHFNAQLSDEQNVNLVRLLAESAGISNIIMAYEDGRSYMSLHKSGISTSEQNFNQREWYQNAKSGNSAKLTDIYVDKITGEKVVSATMPVYYQGQFQGVLLGDILLSDIIKMVSDMRFAGGAATLTDKNAVFFASDDPNDIGKTPSQVSPVFGDMERAFFNQQQGHLQFPYLGIEFDGYFQRVNLTQDQYWTLMVFVDQDTALAGVREAQNEAIVTGVILLLVSAVVMVLTLEHAYKPLLKLKKAVLGLSKGSGDLTARLTVEGGDDLAQISEGFNRFVQSLQGMMLQVSEASQNISSNIVQLNQTAVENEKVLITHSAETDQVVTAITEMSESARSVAENVTQSNRITEGASKEAKQSLEIVNNAVTTVSALVNDVEEMSNRIVSMNQDANKISEVLNVIGEISEQTNLLALNAAIEAARAGEQGRGFAVVADEVRALAARTQNSTTEISEMLSKLLDGTSSVVASMERTKQQCQSTASKTSEVSNSLNLMSGSVRDIDDVSTQIAAATEEQSTVAAELSRNMLAIRDIVTNLVASGRQTVAATESLADSNHELDKLVSNFKLQ
ncbi:methyl-accepting chemotaxis protein [Vibrio vulnificus]|uniref:Methyl-accepting chemotaxis protein n=1 Tax=Vibrio vulnificus TaxID=672 RepID=A0A8H9MXB3_VIBVL|nr:MULTISPECIES: methyl-accepting chemotaxis protein [Vibrio]AVX02220.1 methyl-accepting chemotaxis protein [Vibrio vulnificus Env1]EGQ7693556.1 methyl-accepting chemotaxis protein [Vibrio vulnificus]EGQ7850581.1 methyl-accepting chemotaxis protein [Vibrio vulnificus]EGQ7982274.1 methyl-accepting chemotaxis protein [Vibrio vulnificus]EGQ8021590.1 methyl-accepting chemotaxis protein [Vibrio vulnificus]